MTHTAITPETSAGATGRRRVAVVGSGVAGLTAAYLLQRRYDVLLFEADSRLGGHAHTHELAGAHGRTLAVDSGFIVHNERTYPSLLKLFSELGVTTRETEMSMSVRCDGCGLEYAGARGPRGLLASPRTAVRPEYLRMLLEVKRFHRDARRLLSGSGRSDDEATLDDFLRGGRYSAYFSDHFMIPLVSAVWSSGRDDARRYPARYLFQFLAHHGMLAVTGSPQWRTVEGGSRTYVERVAKDIHAVHLATPVRSIHREAVSGSVRIHDDADAVHTVDHVVIATHPDQALRLLADPTSAERAVLGAMPYSTNETVLHTDASILPTRGAAIGAWNYRLAGCGSRRASSGGAPGTASGDDRAVVTYNMNRLHRFDEPVTYLVTMNATDRIDPGSVIERMVYEHPVYTPQSLAAQSRLPELSTGSTAYAGAYHGWGFHEDGCASGVAAAARFGVTW